MNNHSQRAIVLAGCSFLLAAVVGIWLIPALPLFGWLRYAMEAKLFEPRAEVYSGRVRTYLWPRGYRLDKSNCLLGDVTDFQRSREFLTVLNDHNGKKYLKRLRSVLGERRLGLVHSEYEESCEDSVSVPLEADRKGLSAMLTSQITKGDLSSLGIPRPGVWVESTFGGSCLSELVQEAGTPAEWRDMSWFWHTRRPKDGHRPGATRRELAAAFQRGSDDDGSIFYCYPKPFGSRDTVIVNHVHDRPTPLPKVRRFAWEKVFVADYWLLNLRTRSAERLFSTFHCRGIWSDVTFQSDGLVVFQHCCRFPQIEDDSEPFDIVAVDTN